MIQLNKPITAKLGARFAAQQTLEPLYLSNQIVPITDADRITRNLKVYNVTVSVTSTGTKAGTFTVPANKRWIPIALTAYCNTGSYAVSGNRVAFGRSPDSVLLRQDTTDTGATTDTIILRDIDIELEVGDVLVYSNVVSAKTTNGDILQTLLVYETDLG